MCGFATSFLFLILFRIGTAVGEAGGAPPTQSLISDYFTQDKRATALSIYAMGATLGGMAGNLIGGWGNDLFGWRETFVIAGVPGLLVAFLVFVTVREPPRGASDRAAPPPASAKAPPFMDVLRHLWQRRSFRHMSLAVAVQSFAIFGGAGFGPTYLNRTFDMPLREAGSWLAGFTIFAAAGTLLGGIVADRLSTARNDRRWYMWVPGWGALVIVPAQLLVFLAPSFGYIPPAWILMVILGSSFLGPSYAMTQALVTPQMRAVAAAILIFLTTVIGQGLGPTAVGALSDLLAPVSGVSSLRYAIAIVSLMNLWAVIHYFLAARTLREDLDAVAATTRRASSQLTSNSEFLAFLRLQEREFFLGAPPAHGFVAVGEAAEAFDDRTMPFGPFQVFGIRRQCCHQPVGAVLVLHQLAMDERQVEEQSVLVGHAVGVVEAAGDSGLGDPAGFGVRREGAWRAPEHVARELVHKKTEAQRAVRRLFPFVQASLRCLLVQFEEAPEHEVVELDGLSEPVLGTRFLEPEI